MKRFGKIFRYSLSSGASFLIDIGLYYLLRTLLGTWAGVFADSLCVVIARVCSSFFNFNANRSFVFKNDGSYGRAMLRYYCLAAPVMLCSAGLLTLADRLLGVTAPLLSTLVKIVIDTLLFLVSYFVQKKWVFRKAEPASEETGDAEGSSDPDGR